jgi:GrpB-like predicted nucleotidyltransferase (UPF0157 family)
MSLVVLYSSAWPQQAHAVMAELLPLFAGEAVQAEHIGSTAVPGLCAKPVLDVMLGVNDLALLSARVPALRQAGWRYRPEHEALIPERRYFTRDAEGDHRPRVHLHGVLHGAMIWRQQLAFRDALRQQPALRQAYAELKTQLAAQVDRFITQTLAALLAPRPLP